MTLLRFCAVPRHQRTEPEENMKAFLAAVTAMVVITVAAPFALQQIGFSAADASSGAAVRLD